MSKMSFVVGSLALTSLAFATTAEPVRAAQSGGSLASGAAPLCQVKVSRSASGGVYNVTRQVLSNGKCVCRVTTGPRGQGGSAESMLSELLLRRNCSAAALSTASPGGSTGIFPLVGLGAAAAGGLGAAVATGGSPASP